MREKKCVCFLIKGNKECILASFKTTKHPDTGYSFIWENSDEIATYQ